MVAVKCIFVMIVATEVAVIWLPPRPLVSIRTGAVIVLRPHANASTLRESTRWTLFRDALHSATSVFCPRLLIHYLPLFITTTTLLDNDDDINTTHIVTMSSPSKRRQQKSASATPRRTTRNSQALPSSPPDPSAAQLLGEAASSQRGSSVRRTAGKSSSPINYQSSPVPNGRDAATPMNDVAMSDADRTPRPSGHGIGGKLF